MTAVRSHAGQPLPKLLNGAEQDVVIRRVLAKHAEHAEHGDECSTCALLRTYFVVADWSGMVVDDATDAFANQLRDMLARMNEIGAKPELEDALISRAADEHGTLDERRERLRVQWRLAFALRAEYNQAINEAYPDQYRLDASQLMIDAAAAVNEAETSDLPKLVIVDDFQDATLAGFDFLTALRNRGVRLLLVGNPDEAVQTFRGSYPEYLFNMAQSRLGARLVRLEPSHMAEGTDLAAVASRVSLTIASTESTDDALANRPGKMPAIAIPETHDGSLEAAMYRSTVEELDDVVWKIKTEHLEHGRDWNDMAVIAHDNATVRTFGERLRADGVPVRYSSVTHPLKDEPFVQGLFSMIELAELKRQGIATSSMNLDTAGAYVRSRVASIMNSPLITTPGERPARLCVVESAMNALGSLATVLHDDTADPTTSDTSGRALLPQLIDDWNDYVETFHTARVAASASDTENAADMGLPAIDTDDRLMTGERAAEDADEPSFGMNALYILLLEGDTDRVLDAIASVLGRKDPQAQAFARLWKTLDDTRQSRNLAENGVAQQRRRPRGQRPARHRDAPVQLRVRRRIERRDGSAHHRRVHRTGPRARHRSRLPGAHRADRSGRDARHARQSCRKTLETSIHACVPTRPMAEPLTAQHPVRRGGARRHHAAWTTVRRHRHFRRPRKRAARRGARLRTEKPPCGAHPRR